MGGQERGSPAARPGPWRGLLMLGGVWSRAGVDDRAAVLRIVSRTSVGYRRSMLRVARRTP
jgi:hypothetical protein